MDPTPGVAITSPPSAAPGRSSYFSWLQSLVEYIPPMPSMSSLVPSFHNESGEVRYGLVAVTAGVSAGAAYFLLRSTFSSDARYPYHLIGDQQTGESDDGDGGGGVAAQAAGVAAGDASIQEVEEEEEEVEEEEDPEEDTHTRDGSLTHRGQPFPAAGLVLAVSLLAIALALSTVTNGWQGVYFWEWPEQYPLFLPLFYTALGLLLSQRLVGGHGSDPRRVTPIVSAEEVGIGYVVEKCSIEADAGQAHKEGDTPASNVAAPAGESKATDPVQGGESKNADAAGAGSAALDALWERSERGDATKAALLNAAMQALHDAGNRPTVGLLWRVSRAHSNLASWDPSIDDAQEKNHVEQGFELVQQAVDLATSGDVRVADADVAAAHKFYSILLGQRTKFLPTKEGAALAPKIREHVERALSLDPEDPMLWYILGQWKYSIADLSYAIRYAASWLTGGPVLESTFEDALADFERAHAIAPSFYIDNLVMTARTLLKMGGDTRKARAVSLLTTALAMDVVSPADQGIKRKAQRLSQKLEPSSS